MNIFIETYHLVKKGIDLPGNLIAKHKQEKLLREQQIEQEERARRLLQETMGTVSTVEQAQASLNEQAVPKENLFTFNYIVKDSSGKQIKGSFDAKTITEVEVFLTNEGYEIVKVEPQKKKGNVGLIVFLVILVLGLVGYICYDKFIATNNNLKCKKDEITIVMNMKKGSLKFIIDGEDHGDSYTNIPLDNELYPSVLLYHKEDSVEIMDIQN